MAKRRKKGQGEAPASDAIVTSETIELGAATVDDDETRTGTGAARRVLAMLWSPKLLGAVAAIAILAVLATAGYVAWSKIGTRLATIEAGPRPGDISAAIDNLVARLDVFDKRLAAIEDAPPVAIDVGSVDERLEGIEMRLAEVTADDGGTADLATRIEILERATGNDAAGPSQADLERLTALAADLESRLATIETRAAAPVATQPAMLLAVGQLRAALRGSGPFAAELDAVAALAGDNAGLAEALAPLAGRAGTGVPTVAVLRANFAGVALAVMRATPAADDLSWVDRTIFRLTQLVTVRRVGDVAGDTTEAIFARAEQHIAAGDLAATVSEMQRLDGAPAEAAATWLADARARLAAERALAQLEARAVAAMGGTSGGG